MGAREPAALDVYLGEVLVGSIVALSADETVFSFEPSYIESDRRPILSLGLLDAHGRPRVRPGRVGRIAPYFANLLPEGDLRKYIARNAGLHERNDLAMLWLTGLDLLGSVIVRDPHGRPLPPVALGGPAIAPPADRLLRFSIPGVQLKFSAMQNATGGLTIRASGDDGEYIVKLPSTHFKEVTQNEYAVMTFARRVGLDVPDCYLTSLDRISGLPEDLPMLEGGEREAFIIRRFDRAADGTRIHVEDFNQIYRQYPDQKYDNHDYNEMARDIYRWMGAEALTDFVRRLVFCIATGNTDMHLKNWSLIYADGRTPRLAPVYDFLCTSAYPIDGRNELGLKLGTVKQFNLIDEAAFERFAKRADLAPRLVLAAVRDMRERILTEWPAMRTQVRDLVPFVCDRIELLLGQTPLFQGRGAAPQASEEPQPHQEIV